MTRRSLVVLTVLALVLVACGGGETAEKPETTSPPPTEAGTGEEIQPESTEPPRATTSEAVTAAGSAGEEGSGTATIGDQTWHFELSGNPMEMCDLDVNDAGQVFFVVMFGQDDDGREIALNLGGPVSGGDVNVQVGSPYLEFERWTADATVYDRLGNIEGMPDGVGASVQLEGNTVSGSGIFYDDKRLTDVRPTGDPYDSGTLEGTFEATCPSE